MPSLISADDLLLAAARIAPVAVRTPLLPFDDLTEQLGAPIWLKPEMLQRGGAFKFRGAYNFLAQLSSAQRARGVIAPSSGNHAQAVALAAKLFGCTAVAVMPTTVTPAKRAGAERLGARIELAGTSTFDRYDRAVEIAAREGLTLVPPYDHPWIIAGQGTAGLEIADDLDVTTVLVPVGGGGLSAGVAAAIKLKAPHARVIGVEPSSAPKLTKARDAGRPVRITPTPGGLADGLQAVEIGGITFAHHQAFLDDVVQVGDAPLKRAMRVLLDRMKIVAEPSGAITLAALMEGIVAPNGSTVAVLSGGNVEWAGLGPLLADL
ncbi:MAG: threonine/serine dehydratase [Gemmatimonadaceae bacterium]|nr:threonine/serine dehydratase [Geodermatophilaceae bacterium]MBA3670828.1 threonine/serine dehydratase [Gemmatimonadaceae bacterium]